jgi:hypothetical protein
MNVTYAATNMIKIRWSERSQVMAFYPHRMMSDLSIIVAAIFTILPFLVVFAKLRKANINFVNPSVRPSVRMEQLASHPTDFREITYLCIFRKPVEKTQVSLKSGKITGTLCEDHNTFLIISHSIILRMRKVSDESYRENQNTFYVP